MLTLIRARLYLIALALGPLVVQAESFALRPQAEVNARGIFLEQIVTTTNSQAIANIQLAPAPAWGQIKVLSRAEITQLLVKAAPNLAQSVLTGPTEVRIARQSRTLADKELIALLTEKLQPGPDSGEFELRLTSQWKPLPIPAEQEALDLRVISRPVTSRVSPLVRFELGSKGEMIGAYTVNVQASLFREVWVAQSAITPGTTLEEADIALERRDVLKEPAAPWIGRNRDQSTHFVHTLQAGGIVLARAVKTRPVVRRGQQIQAVARAGNVMISDKVEAMEDGAPEQFIKARNIRTQKVIVGKVVNASTIEVTL